MTLPRLQSLTAYWKKHPPVHIVAAAFAGIKPESENDDTIEKTGKMPEFVDLPEYEEGAVNEQQR